MSNLNKKKQTEDGQTRVEKLIKSWSQHYDLFEATKSKCDFDYIKHGSKKIKVQLDGEEFYVGKSSNGKPHGKGIFEVIRCMYAQKSEIKPPFKLTFKNFLKISILKKDIMHMEVQYE